MRSIRLRLSIAVTAVLLPLCAGCPGANVGSNARASLSSFVTSIVNGVITEAINGDN